MPLSLIQLHVHHYSIELLMSQWHSITTIYLDLCPLCQHNFRHNATEAQKPSSIMIASRVNNIPNIINSCQYNRQDYQYHMVAVLCHYKVYIVMIIYCYLYTPTTARLNSCTLAAPSDDRLILFVSAPVKYCCRGTRRSNNVHKQYNSLVKYDKRKGILNL